MCQRLDAFPFPAFALIKFPQQFQPAKHGGIDMRSQAGDVIFQLLNAVLAGGGLGFEFRTEGYGTTVEWAVGKCDVWHVSFL
ncbi:hypothetical protein D3C83_118770 [compost metagenome]